MPFTLTVSKGAGAGAEFPIDAAEARLGRTADNDIVVKDSGASRSHARVFQKGARFYVEDMKSANGTKVNNAVINSVKEVKTGDTISIGEVVFIFRSQDQTVLKPPPDDAMPNIADGETMLKNPLPPDVVTGESPALDFSSTSEVPALEPEDPNATMLKPPLSMQRQDPERERRTTGGRQSMAKELALKDDATTPPTRAPKRHSLSMSERASDQGTAEVAPLAVRRGGGKASDDDDENELTAADKLRMRRQANKTALGRFSYAWAQLPKTARIATSGVAALFVLATFGFVIYSILPAKKKTVGPEPQEITGGAPTIEASFGVGEGVTFERVDMKVFSFNATSATRIVGVLHYQARDVSKDEISVSVNGFDLGFVPPDTLDTANRELELVLPAQQVKKGAANQIIFDNTKNPPGEDSWRIWNLWLELIAIPDMSPEETVQAVKEDLERSQKFYEQRDIGPDNLFKAWKGYRDAWLKMESMTTRPDELYIVARSQQREIAQMLEKRCSMMVLEFQKAMNAKKPDRKAGRLVLEEMLRYFPSREHRCHGLARSMLEDFGVTM